MSESENATLFLDASTPLMQAGVLGSAGWLSLKQVEGDAISLLAALASSALKEAGLAPVRVRSFGFCEGPGTLLGLRLSAMLVNTWLVLPGNIGKKVLAYRSVDAALAVHALDCRETRFRVATAIRRGVYSFSDFGGESCGICGPEALAPAVGKLFTIAQRRAPEGESVGTPLSYSIERLPEAARAFPGLLRECSAAEVYAPVLSEYKLWEGGRHRA